MPPSKLPTIPAADVAKHNTSKSCYVTVGANVYDVTDFIEGHPGGPGLILDYAGKDVEEIMQGEDSTGTRKDDDLHFHPDSAYKILNERHIGFIATVPIQDAAVEIDNPTDIVPLVPNDTGKESLQTNGAARRDLGEREVFRNTVLKTPEETVQFTDPEEDFRKHGFLKLDEPLLMQVWRSGMSKEKYLDEVHTARFYDGSAPLFGNFLEPLSLTPFWVVPLIWLPCVAWGTYVASQGLEPMHLVGYWMIGFCLWSFIEYGMHRGLFHVDKYASTRLQMRAEVKQC